MARCEGGEDRETRKRRQMRAKREKERREKFRVARPGERAFEENRPDETFQSRRLLGKAVPIGGENDCKEKRDRLGRQVGVFEHPQTVHRPEQQFSKGGRL